MDTPMQIEQILRLAKQYGRQKNLCVSTLGCYAVNDGKFFDRVAKGGSCTLRTASRVFEFFSDNWPDGELAWPSDIPRPERTADRRSVA